LGNLGTDLNGSSFSGASAINDAGTAVGYAVKYDASGNHLGNRAVRWDNSGAATELGVLGAAANGVSNSFAVDVNASGAVVGYTAKYDAAGAFLRDVPVRWDGTGTAAVELSLLGPAPAGLPPTLFGVLDINDAGTAVGYSDKYDSSGNYFGNRAVRWNVSGTAISELGNLGVNELGLTYSIARAINAAGTAVGDAATLNEFGSLSGGAAVYWRSDGVPVDLNTLIDPDSGWLLWLGEAISDTGWIAGVGDFDPDGPSGQNPYHRLFLIHVPEAAVPEASSFALALLELSTLGLVTSVRQKRPTTSPGPVTNITAGRVYS
jgi:hypothetical protein